MTKLEYKAQYRALRIALKLNPDYIPKTEVEYDLYSIYCNRPTFQFNLNQLLVDHYGKQILSFSSQDHNPFLGSIKRY